MNYGETTDSDLDESVQLSESEEEQQLRDEIEKAVSRINGTYGTVGWAPISYQFQNRPFPEVVALFARADIALVTPIRDGMNLVAKEFVASKKKPSGVLVLSEMAGAIDELPEALTINPTSVSSIKQAIVTALEMPRREQATRMQAMQKRLAVATVQNWSSEFMNSLASSKNNHNSRYKKLLLPAEVRRIATRFKAAEKRLIILDYDGTLKNFVKTPTSIRGGAPSLRTIRIIRALSEEPNTVVAIVSGRPRKALMHWFVGMKVKLAAEHGAWTRYDKKWHKIDSNFASDKKQIRALMQSYTERTVGSQIEEKDYTLVWHYVNVEPDLAYSRSRELRRELRQMFEDKDISVDEGHNILEVKPKSLSKGNVAKDLVGMYPSDFVLCIGDDYTDEDMFAALNDEAYTTIKVGSGDTKAHYQLDSVDKVLDLLSLLKPDPSRPLGELAHKLAKSKAVLRLLLGVDQNDK